MRRLFIRMVILNIIFQTIKNMKEVFIAASWAFQAVAVACLIISCFTNASLEPAILAELMAIYFKLN